MRISLKKVYICLCLIVYLNPSFAKSGSVKAATRTKKEFIGNSVVEIPAPDLFMNFYFLALSGETIESLKLIYADIKKNNADKKGSATIITKISGQPKFKLTVKNNFLFINNKNSHLKFISFYPLKVKYKGLYWTYNSNISADRNYFSLKKVLLTNSTSGLLELLINRAWAQENSISSKKGKFEKVENKGVLADSKEYAMLTAATCAVVWSACPITGSMYGFTLGLTYLIKDQRAFDENTSILIKESKAKNKFLRFLRNVNQIDCDKDGVSIKNSQNEILFIDPSGNLSDNTYKYLPDTKNNDVNLNMRMFSKQVCSLPQTEAVQKVREAADVLAQILPQYTIEEALEKRGNVRGNFGNHPFPDKKPKGSK